VLLLSLSLGVPVVATRVGAFPEVITDGETGMLVEPGDRAALAAAITRALGDPHLRARMAEGGRRIARDTYSWPAIAGRTAVLFTALAAPASGGATVGTGETS
jgi:glycosyltransferase involved in cell wall biosynthesis